MQVTRHFEMIFYGRDRGDRTRCRRRGHNRLPGPAPRRCGAGCAPRAWLDWLRADVLPVEFSRGDVGAVPGAGNAAWRLPRAGAQGLPRVVSFR